LGKEGDGIKTSSRLELPVTKISKGEEKGDEKNRSALGGYRLTGKARYGRGFARGVQ